MFSKEWKKIYKAGKQFSVWPWSDLVSQVNKYIKLKYIKSKVVVLELGSGVGANIPFFLNSKFDYHCIEGSAEAIKVLLKRFPQLKKKIFIGDFTFQQPFKKKFDLVVDRGSLTHNDTYSVKRALKLLRKSLKKNGIYIGIDWFSTNDSDFTKGRKINDKFTKTSIRSGKLKQVGKIHFADKKHLLGLFKDWKILELFEKKNIYYFPLKNFTRATWIIVAKKI